MALSTNMTVLAVATLASLASPSIAWADEVFSVSGSFSNIDGDNGSATFQTGSTVTIDPSTGFATNSALTLALTGGLYGGDTVTLDNFDLGGIFDKPSPNVPVEYYWQGVDPGPGPQCPADSSNVCVLVLVYSTGNGFVGFTGGAMTSGFFEITPGAISQATNFASQVTLTPVSTPEPSIIPTLACLLTIMGAVLVRRSPVALLYIASTFRSSSLRSTGRSSTEPGLNPGPSAIASVCPSNHATKLDRSDPVNRCWLSHV
jgi:hypothetical protein